MTHETMILPLAFSFCFVGGTVFGWIARGAGIAQMFNTASRFPYEDIARRRGRLPVRKL